MGVWQKWWYAAKPLSWPKLLVPAALGYLVGSAAVASGEGLAGEGLAGEGAVGPESWVLGVGTLVFGIVFTALDLLAIVFLNDWGDRDVDAIKRRMFPDGCSPKTIPDGILPARALLIAGCLAAVALVGVSVVGAQALDRPHLWILGVAAALSFQIYTFGPVRLNYRGGGELVEALGVGVLLPFVGAYAWSGLLWHPAYTGAFAGTACLSFGSALASGLSDEESDRAGGKRTFTTALGNPFARQAALISLCAGAAMWVLAAAILPAISWVAAVGGGLVVVLQTRRAQRLSPTATTGAFREQGRFKHHLHLAIWWGMAVFAVLQTVCSHLI